MSHIIVPLTPLTYLYTSDTRYERRLNHASPKPKARNEQVLSLVSSIGTAEEHPVLEATNQDEEVAAPMTSITSREVCLESTRLGLQLYAQGQQREALEAFDTALALDDTICLTWVGKGKVRARIAAFP